MAQSYKVVKTEPWSYIDRGNAVVQGFRVTVDLLDFNESHMILVRDLDPALIKREAEALVAQRKALAAL